MGSSQSGAARFREPGTPGVLGNWVGSKGRAGFRGAPEAARLVARGDPEVGDWWSLGVRGVTKETRRMLAWFGERRNTAPTRGLDLTQPLPPRNTVPVQTDS